MNKITADHLVRRAYIHGGHVTCYPVELSRCGVWRMPGNSEE
jgi:hypothetical protein